jgi:hypothetical protein
MSWVGTMHLKRLEDTFFEEDAPRLAAQLLDNLMRNGVVPVMYMHLVL